MERNKIESSSVVLYTRTEDFEGRVLKGRSFYDSKNSEFIFFENKPRGPRSKEVVRTPHGRAVVRPDGDYTITFRLPKDFIVDGYYRLRDELGLLWCGLKSNQSENEDNNLVI